MDISNSANIETSDDVENLLVVNEESNTSLNLNKYSYLCENNEEIDSNITNAVTEVYNEVISVVIDCDEEAFEQLLSQVLKDSGNINISLEEISPIFSQPATIKNTHYLTIESEAVMTIPVVPTIDKELDSYIFNVVSAADNIYLIFTEFEYVGTSDLLRIEFIPEDETWKVLNFNIAPYSYNGMNALELCSYAEELYEEELWVQAKLYAVAARKLLTSYGISFYNSEKEFNETCDEILNTNNEIFDNIAGIDFEGTNLQIIGFDIITTNKEGISPRINYTTNTSLKDTEQLEKEANVIIESIDEIFPRFTETFDLFAVTAYNELPIDSTKTYSNFTTVIEGM